MNNISNSTDTLISNFNQSQDEYFTKSETLNGTIQSLENGKYTIEFDNKKQIQVDENSIIGKVGDNISFEVVDSKTLKQTSGTSTTIIQEENIEFKDLTATDIISTEEKYNAFLSENKLTDKDILYSITSAKNSLSEISNTATASVIQKLIDSGINPKELDLNTFKQYLEENMGAKDDNEPVDLIELKEQVYKNIKFDLNMNGIDEENAMRFEEILKNADLPITEKNMKMVSNTDDKLEELKSMTDKQIYSILKNKDTKSIDDLYSAKHSGISQSDTSITDLSTITKLDEQIIDLFKQESIIQDTENIQTAKNFILEGVEVSSESFKKFKKLKNLKNENNNDVIAKSLKNNNNFFNNIDELQKYKEMASDIKEEDIQLLLNRNIPVTLGNLYQNYNSNLGFNELHITNLDENQISNLAKTEKLNLAKIQMKLTMENMYSLCKNGISIDTKPLSKVIETLESLETNSIKNTLEKVNALVSEQNIRTMKDVSETLKSFYPNNVYNTFKGIIKKEVTFNLEGIKQTFKAQKLINDFDIYKTQPIKSFGDTLNKMETEFKSFLEEKGFEPNETNIKAVKILSLNDLDATEENIIKTKIIDEKLTYVHDNLHSLAVAKMLKNDFNPMEKTIDEVISYIDDTKDEFEQTSREKIAEQILEIDKENNLSKEERSAIVAVYRMLNAIEKGDSGAIGTILQSEKNLTFKNLLEASKIYNSKVKKLSVDKIVDDNSGTTEKQDIETIQSTINTAISKLNSEYNTLLVKNAVNNSTSEDIKEALENYETIENSLLNSTNKKDLKVLEDIRNFEKMSTEVINAMIRNEIPITINNVEVMKNILKNDKKPSDVIRDFKKELESKGIEFGDSIFNLHDEDIITKEEALSTLDELNEENEEVFDDILDLEDLDIIKSMILKNRDVSLNLKFLKDNNKVRNGIYSVPMELSNGKITDLNMFVLNDKALDDKNLKFYLNFENDDNKQVQAFVEVFNDGTNVNISTKKDYFENVEDNKADIFSILAKFNINPENTTYSIQDDRNIFKSNSLIF